jgi:hypothetical protein
MPKYQLTKTIEARKLNKRTRVPTSEPSATIPFGGIIDDLTEERDLIKFSYLGEPYQCLAEVLNVAIAPVQSLASAAPSAQAEPDMERPTAVSLLWEELRSSHGVVLRAKVPGGWLVRIGSGITFYPDAEHRWSGASRP